MILRDLGEHRPYPEHGVTSPTDCWSRPPPRVVRLRARDPDGLDRAFRAALAQHATSHARVLVLN